MNLDAETLGLIAECERNSATFKNARRHRIPLDLPAEIGRIEDSQTLMEALAAAAFQQGISTAEQELRDRFANLCGDPSRLGARSDVTVAALAIVEALIVPADKLTPGYRPPLRLVTDEETP